MKKISLSVFVIALLLVLIAEMMELSLLYYVSKPLIMLSLIAYYLLSLRSEQRSTTMVCALLFSLAGDVLLMSPLYFIGGLAAFVIAHVCYIFAYRQHQSDQSENALLGLHRIRLAFPIFLVGTGLVVVLYPVLGDLRIPVIVYALAITVMVLQALFRYGRTSSESFWFVFSGAVLFMISDSVLAINKFLQPVGFAGVIIMLTYALAQALIVEGVIGHQKN